jgi:hypothetical protein
MKRLVVLLSSVAAIVLVLTMAACGGVTRSSAPSEPQAEVSVVIDASPGHLGASETYQFIAVVSNTSDTAVHWSLFGCSAGCGSISDSGLFSAPTLVESVTTVTIIATAHADGTKWASVTIRLTPVSLLLTPVMGTVVPGGTRALTAWTDHDPNHAGVTWTLSGAGCSGGNCGALSDVTATTATYHAPETAPAPPTVTITATSVTDSHCSATVTLTVTATPFALTGKYAFLINGWHDTDIYRKSEAIAGQFDADGQGRLTGVVDANFGDVVETGRAVTGSYDIRPDGSGTMTLALGGTNRTYIVAMGDAGASGMIAESSSGYPLTEQRASSGYLVQQDDGSFSLASIQGDRVIALHGDATNSYSAALGRFTSDATGNLSNGVADLSWKLYENVGHFPTSVTLTGAFATPESATGRGTAALNVAPGVTYHFAYYIVSAEQILLAQMDVAGYAAGLLVPKMSGEVRRQAGAGNFTTDLTLNDVTVFHATDATARPMAFDCASAPDIRIGTVKGNGPSGLVVNYDENNHGQITSNAAETGPYSVSPNGRVTWNVPEPTIAYLLENNRGYFAKSNGCTAGFGVFEPQQGEPFSAASLAGIYLLSTTAAGNIGALSNGGWMSIASDGTVSGTLYVNTGWGSSPYALTGTATIASDGRGTLVFNTTTPPSTAPSNVVFRAISPAHIMAILTVNPGDSTPVLLDLRRAN